MLSKVTVALKLRISQGNTFSNAFNFNFVILDIRDTKLYVLYKPQRQVKD